MKKVYILAILEGFKKLSENAFDQLSIEEKESDKDYQKGYLDALDMLHDYFSKKEI